MVQYIVWTGLSNAKKDVAGINKFFKDEGWGKVKYIMEFKTVADNSGPGGRTDVVFQWTGKGNEVGKFSIGRFRMGGISWLGDYIANNQYSLIPIHVIEKLRAMRNKSGDYGAE